MGKGKGAGIRHSRTQDLVCHNHPTDGASSHALHRKKPGGQEGMRSGKAQVSERTMVRCRHARSGESGKQAEQRCAQRAAMHTAAALHTGTRIGHTTTHTTRRSHSPARCRR